MVGGVLREKGENGFCFPCMEFGVSGKRQRVDADLGRKTGSGNAQGAPVSSSDSQWSSGSFLSNSRLTRVSQDFCLVADCQPLKLTFIPSVGKKKGTDCVSIVSFLELVSRSGQIRQRQMWLCKVLGLEVKSGLWPTAVFQCVNIKPLPIHGQEHPSCFIHS